MAKIAQVTEGFHTGEYVRALLTSLRAHPYKVVGPTRIYKGRNKDNLDVYIGVTPIAGGNFRVRQGLESCDCGG